MEDLEEEMMYYLAILAMAVIATNCHYEIYHTLYSVMLQQLVLSHN